MRQSQAIEAHCSFKADCEFGAWEYDGRARLAHKAPDTQSRKTEEMCSFGTVEMRLSYSYSVLSSLVLYNSAAKNLSRF
jgi:hypothetical protein